MITTFANKLIFVDQRFLDNLSQTSMTEWDEFSNPGLDTAVIPLPLSSAEDITELTRLVDTSAIRPGNIVVKPGFSDQYVPVEHFAEDLALRKYSLFVRLCVALGAKRVFVKHADSVSLNSGSETVTNAKMGASAPVGKINAGVEGKGATEDSRIEQSLMSIKTEALGGEPDLEEATRLMDQFGLHKDTLFLTIFGLRNHAQNRASKHELEMDFSQDLKKVLDSSLQAKVKVMSHLYEGKIDFERARKSIEKTKTATRLTITVEF